MESDTFYGDFMVKQLIWRLSCNLIHHSLSIKNPNNLQTKLPLNLHENYHSPNCIHKISVLIILVIRFTMFSR